MKALNAILTACHCYYNRCFSLWFGFRAITQLFANCVVNVVAVVAAVVVVVVVVLLVVLLL